MLQRDESQTSLFKLQSENVDELSSEVSQLSSKIQQCKQANKKVSLMISGATFSFIPSLNEQTTKVFLSDVLMAADAVILFRSSPKQKADTVNMIKKFFGGRKITMSIGDGFNDVNMIQEAHVGIGIRGAESA